MRFWSCTITTVTSRFAFAPRWAMSALPAPFSGKTAVRDSCVRAFRTTTKSVSFGFGRGRGCHEGRLLPCCGPAERGAGGGSVEEERSASSTAVVGEAALADAATAASLARSRLATAAASAVLLNVWGSSGLLSEVEMVVHIMLWGSYPV